MITRLAAVAAVGVALVTATACSSSVSGSGSASSGPSSSTSSPSEPGSSEPGSSEPGSSEPGSSVPGSSTGSDSSSTPPRPVDTSKIILRASDLPSGWTSQAYKPSAKEQAQNDRQNAKVARCTGIPDTASQKVGTVYSPEFLYQQRYVANSESSTYRTDEAVTTDARLFTAPNASKCVGTFYAANIGLPASAVHVTVHGRGAGDPSNLVGRTDITAQRAGQTIHYTVYSLVGRRVEANFNVGSNSDPLSTSTQRAVLARFAARVAQA